MLERHRGVIIHLLNRHSTVAVYFKVTESGSQ